MVWAALIPAIASLAGSAMQANAAGEAAEVQERLGQQQNRIAERQLLAALAKRVDSRGNQQVYDEGSNTFRTILSERGQQLQDVSDEEELRRNLVDQMLRRQGLQSNAVRRANEGAAASPMLQEISRRFERGPNNRVQSITDQLTRASRESINEGFDRTQQNALLTALRSGTGGMQNIMRAAAGERSRALEQSALQAKLQGLSLGSDLVTREDNQLLNQYNTLAGRASNFEDAPFIPDTVGDNANASQGQAIAQMLAGLSAGAGTSAQAGIFGSNAANIRAQSGKELGQGVESMGPLLQLLAQKGFNSLKSGAQMGNRGSFGNIGDTVRFS